MIRSSGMMNNFFNQSTTLFCSGYGGARIINSLSILSSSKVRDYSSDAGSENLPDSSKDLSKETKANRGRKFDLSDGLSLADFIAGKICKFAFLGKSGERNLGLLGLSIDLCLQGGNRFYIFYRVIWDVLNAFWH